MKAAEAALKAGISIDEFIKAEVDQMEKDEVEETIKRNAREAYTHMDA
jgi:hypothetical protein